MYCHAERHPNAAKVHRVYVDPGTGERLHVWCGAFNMQAGDVVPLATLGTVMPDGREIQRRGILGIDSEGMLCSARELGLGEDQAGILELATDALPGTPLLQVIESGDVRLELDVLAKRPTSSRSAAWRARWRRCSSATRVAFRS